MLTIARACRKTPKKALTVLSFDSSLQAMFESSKDKPWTPPNEGARLLKRVMDRQKLSQYRVERDIGAARGMVSMWLSGHRRPGVEWAEKLRAKYGIAPLAWHRPPRSPRTKAATEPAAGQEPVDLSQPAA